MKRLLFITNRNVLTTSGELRLIKNRAESLYNDYGITTDFIALGTKERINSSKREKIEAGGSMHEIPTTPVNLLSFICKAGHTYKTIVSKAKEGHYDAAILSGPGMTLYTPVLKKYIPKVYIDIHGALEDALELSASASTVKSIFFKLLYEVQEYEFKKYLKVADGSFVVTKALEEYIRDRYELLEGFTFHIVPCATKGLENMISDREVCRAKYRKKYGIEDDTIVFVYSGGLSPWQCVEETIELYRRIASDVKVKTKMLLFSHMFSSLKEMIGDDDRFILDSHKSDTLREALCAADYAFMLRKDCPTNNVAFPNKFLEYVESGLNIISTPYVYEIYSQIEKFGIGIIINDLTDSSTIEHAIENGGSYGNDVTKDVLLYNSFRNRLRPFVDVI